jgi:N-sulfoglucosamine sulfohydrolase
MTKLISFFMLSIFLLTLNGYSQNQKKPNILVIVAEDLSPHLGCYGDPLVKTPNLDHIASEGVRYTNMFTTAGVCAPSRSALITGMYQTSIGTHHMRTSDFIFPNAAGNSEINNGYSRVLPPKVKCFSEYLRAEGYFCSNNNKTDYQFDAPLTAWDENDKHAHWRNRMDVNKPFFSIFNFNVTHESQLWNRIKEPIEVDPLKVLVPPYYHDSPKIRMGIARFLSNVNELDRQIGKLLNQLVEDSLLDNTIIIFYSDHGDGLPYVKREILNRGIQVPFIIRYPQKEKAGLIDSNLHSFIDIAPSILSVANIPIPKYFQGTPFFGINGPGVIRKYVFAARDRLDNEYDRVRSVRDTRFQYLRNFYPELPYYMNITYRLRQPMMKEMIDLRDSGKLTPLEMRWFQPKEGTEELYDLEKDPYQFNNLAKKKEYQYKLRELSNAMNNWIKKFDFWGDMPEKEMVAQQWPNGIQPATEIPTVAIKNTKCILTCKTTGASIAYKIWSKSNKEPTHWALYSKPFFVSNRDTLQSVAIRIGYSQSKEFTKDNLTENK